MTNLEKAFASIWFFVPIVFIAIGLYFLLTPPKHILQWEGRAGYWIYRTELSATGDEGRAIKAAGRFYKALGIAGVTAGTSTLLIGLFFGP